MIRNFFLKLKVRYLLFFLLLGFIININLFYLSSIFIFIKFYLKKNNILFLLASYTFLSFLIFDYAMPKLTLEKSDYYTKSNIEYDINKFFGYFPKKNTVFEEQIYFKDNLLKVNKYNINSYGHRKTYRSNLKDDDCIVLFGGSITFGQSLNENETLSSLIYLKLNQNKSVYNFVFNGYGPHQFLSKLNNNYYQEIKNCNKVSFIYFYIDDHVGRVVGKRSWGDKSPRFVIENGNLIQKDFFSSYPFKIIMKIRKNFRNSKILSLLHNVNLANTEDELLFVKILENIEKKAKSKFPSSETFYILWNRDDSNFKIVDIFFKNKKKIHIEELNISQKYLYNNIPGDNHPAKEFNDILSSIIINNFFGEM